ncbi:MAG: anthranilate phosphoribosyltransferase [Myxococcaceae bacterium]
MTAPHEARIRDTLALLIEGHSLSREASRALFRDVLLGHATPAQIGALLVALRHKGETADEIAGAADALRDGATPFQVPKGVPIFDTCGTGGDGAQTFNVSTAAAFVVAGAGVHVAKHGNRSVSSRAGSADVLAAAGVNLEAPLERVEGALREVGIGFLFAPALHPGLAHVSAPRREVGVRSIFNILGPLVNPAKPTHQLLGVYSAALVPVLGQALAQLGITRALVVHGEDGLDEISPTTASVAAWVEGGAVKALRLHPKDAGISPVSPGAIKGGGAKENAETLRRVFQGEAGPHRDAVLLNAGAALWVAGKTADWRSGVALATQVLDSGAALQKLDALCRYAQGGTS